MKRFYTFLASALLVAGSAFSQVTLPYESGSFESAPGTSVLPKTEWSKQDNGGSGSWNATTRFKYDSAYYPMMLSADGNYGSNDDWLISPSFTIKEGNKYKISFAAKTQSVVDGVDYKVYFVGLSPISDVEFAAYYPNQSFTLTTSYTVYDFTFDAEENAEDYYFAIRVQGKNQPVYVANVKIEEIGGGSTPEQPEKPVDPTPGDHDCKGVQAPYSSSIAIADGNSAVKASDWDVINANNDAKTWKAETNSYTESKYGMKYQYNTAADADDYLISPAIHLEAGKEYIVRYGYMTYTDPETTTLYASTDKTPEAIKAGTTIDKRQGSFNKFEIRSNIFVPEVTQDYYFSFHCTSLKNKWWVLVSDFSVVENVFAPASVSNLTAKAGANRAISCTLNWTLPTKSTLGADLTADQTVEKVEIFRDGGATPIATLNEAATSFEDTEALGLTSGKHTYSVVVTVAGVASAPATITSPYVGPVAPAPVPCEFTIGSADDFSLYTTETGDKSTNSGDFKYNTGGYAEYECYSDRVIDAWIYSLPFSVSEPGYYRVTFSSKVGYTQYSMHLEGAVGTTPSAAAMEVKSDAFTFGSDWTDNYYDFYVSEPGVYYAGLHVDIANMERYQKYQLKNIRVAATKYVPGVVSDLTLTPDADEALGFTLSWKNPMTSFAGNAIASIDYNVNIYINNELYKTLTPAELTAGTQTLHVDVAEAGVYSVKVQTVSSDETTAPEHPSVTSEWIGSKIVALPYECAFNDMTDSTIGLWEVIDGNDDGASFAIDSEKYRLQLSKISEDDEYDYWTTYYYYDDYLLTPYFDLKPGTYKFSYYVGGTNKFSYKIGLVKAGQFSKANKQYVVKENRTTTSTSASETSYTVKVTEAGIYQIAIVVDDIQTATSVYSNLAISSPKMEEVLLLPGIASDVTVTANEDFELEATVTWTNPEDTNDASTTLVDGDIVKAIVYRNGEAIATVTDNLVPGTQTSYIDTELPNAGIYTYKVEIYNANGCSETEATEVTSPWIGGGLEIPYSFSTIKGAGDEDFANWDLTNTNTDPKKENCWINSSNGITVQTYNAASDSWAVSPKLTFHKGHIYKIEVTMHTLSYGGYADHDVKLYHGTTSNVNEFKELETYHVESAHTSGEPLNSSFTVYAVDPAEAMALAAEEGTELSPEEELINSSVKVPAGVATLAFRQTGEGATRIKHVAITHEKDVTGIEGVTVGDGICYNGNGLSFEGEAAVEVYDLAGALVAADPHAVDGFDLETLENGIYIVRVSPANGKTVTLKIAK